MEDARRRRCGDLSCSSCAQPVRAEASAAATPRVRHDLRSSGRRRPRGGGGAAAVVRCAPRRPSRRRARRPRRRASATRAGRVPPARRPPRQRPPPALRVYPGCAGKFHGEAQDADMVKVHLGSSKVTLMTYDDYEGRRSRGSSPRKGRPPPPARRLLPVRRRSSRSRSTASQNAHAPAPRGIRGAARVRRAHGDGGLRLERLWPPLAALTEVLRR